MGYTHNRVVFDLKTFEYTNAEGKKDWLTAVDKAVLSAIATRCNEARECFPGFGVLASDTLFSRRAVMRSVATLKHLGFISVKKRGSGRLSNTYVIDMEAIERQLRAETGKPPKREGNFGKLKGGTDRRITTALQAQIEDDDDLA